MPMFIREQMDGKLFYEAHEASAAPKSPEMSVEESANASESIDPDSIMVDIEAIHSMPFATRNFTRYSPKCIKNSIPHHAR